MVQRAISFLFDCWIAFNILHEFPDVVFLGFLCNLYSVTRRSIRPDLSKGLKWPLFFIPLLDRAQIFA
jgi:hypothetical protein